MKYLILILLSLSLVGLSSNSYAESLDFITTFDGTGGTPFNNPNGVAVDSNDRIFVSEINTSLVQIFDSEGVFDTDFTPAGLTFPGAIAIDSSDRIIISKTQFGGAQVKIFENDETFVADLAGGSFMIPIGIAVDSTGIIFVADIFTNVVQIFENDGTFLGSFDGLVGGDSTVFTAPRGLAVDSNDRLIVGDSTTGLVQIFNDDGSFATSFNGGGNGGTPFITPAGIAVDSSDRIIVGDVFSNRVQIYDSNGVFLDMLDDGLFPFASPFAIAVDFNDRIIILDNELGLVHIFEGFSVADNAAEGENKPGNACSGDCTPPTIGLTLNFDRVVDNGFSYNNNPVDVIAWHTPYPLITAIVNQTNIVEIIVYENQGISNLAMVQFGLGLEDFGQSLHDVEVLIEVHLEPLFSENTVIVEKVVIRDRDNLIDTFSVFAVTETVQCIDDAINEECIKVFLEYSYREATINNMMVVNVMDISRNSQNFYLNDGVKVIGESMNPAPTYIMNNKKTNQQTENITLTLTRTDKVNHIWMDENGIEYLQISNNRFDRITPIASIIGLDGFKVNQDPLQSVQSRLNSNFDVIVNYEKIRAVQHFDSSLIQGTLYDSMDDSIGESAIVHVVPRLEKLGDSIEIEQVKAQEIMYDLLHPVN